MLRTLRLAVLLIALVASPPPATAEWFADLYAGAAFTDADDHTNRARAFDLDVVVLDIAYKDSAVIGGRAGYWFDSFPFLGIGVDASHVFGPDIGVQTASFDACVPAGCLIGPQAVRRASLNVTSVGLDLLLRWPLLISSAFPRGRLQPYVAVGPTVFIAHFRDTSNFSSSDQSDTDTAVGPKVAGGLAWQITRHLAAFAEYRFTHFKAEWEFQSDRFGRVEVNAPITTHSILGGLSLRFP
jgi:opacity protein-like surface antigen